MEDSRNLTQSNSQNSIPMSDDIVRYMNLYANYFDKEFEEFKKSKTFANDDSAMFEFAQKMSKDQNNIKQIAIFDLVHSKTADPTNLYFAYASLFNKEFNEFTKQVPDKSATDQIARFLAKECLSEDFDEKLKMANTYSQVKSQSKEELRNALSYATYYISEFTKFKQDNQDIKDENEQIAQFYALESGKKDFEIKTTDAEVYRKALGEDSKAFAEAMAYSVHYKEDFEKFKEEYNKTGAFISDNDAIARFYLAERNKGFEYFIPRVNEANEVLKTVQRQMSENTSTNSDDPYRNTILESGNIRTSKKTQQVNEYRLQSGETIGVSQPISLGKDFAPQQIISTNDELNLISIIQDGKVLASFQEAENGKIKLVFSDESLKSKFVQFYEKNTNLTPTFTMENDSIILDNVVLDSRLDLRVSGANTNIGFLFSAFGLQIADNAHNSAVYRNDKISPFSIAVSNHFIDRALNGQQGYQIDADTNSSAMKALLIGSTLNNNLTVENQANLPKIDKIIKTQTFGSDGKEEFSTVSAKTTVYARDGMNVKKDEKGNFVISEKPLELKFLEKTSGKNSEKQELFFYCSLAIPDSNSTNGTVNLRTDYYRVADIEMFDTKAPKSSPYEIDGMPNDGLSYIRIMLQDPKDPTKTYATIYPVPTKDNKEVINLINVYNKIYSNKNLRKAQDKNSNETSNEKIALAQTYSDEEVASFSKSRQKVSTIVDENGPTVITINKNTMHKIGETYNIEVTEDNGASIIITNGGEISRSATLDANPSENPNDGDGESQHLGDIGTPPPPPTPPTPQPPIEPQHEEPIRETQDPSNEPSHQEFIPQTEYPMPPGLKGDAPKTEDGPLRNPNIYSALGLIFAILSVFMPFLLPLSFVSFGVAITKPWTWPQKFQQNLRESINRKIIKQQKHVMTNNMTRERLNILANSYNREMNQLLNDQTRLERTGRALNTSSYERLPQFERDNLTERRSTLENRESELLQQIEEAKNANIETLRSMLQADSIERRYDLELQKLRAERNSLPINPDMMTDEQKEQLKKLEKQINSTEQRLIKIKEDKKELAEVADDDFGRRYVQYLQSELAFTQEGIRIIDNSLMFEEFLDNIGANPQNVIDQYRDDIKEELELNKKRIQILEKLKGNVQETLDRISGDKHVVRKGSRKVKKLSKGIEDDNHYKDGTAQTIFTNVEGVVDYNNLTRVDQDIVDYARTILSEDYNPNGQNFDEQTSDLENHYSQIENDITSQEDDFIKKIAEEEENKDIAEIFKQLQQINASINAEQEKEKKREEQLKKLEELEKNQKENPEVMKKIEKYKHNLMSIRELKRLNRKKREEALKKLKAVKETAKSAAK